MELQELFKLVRHQAACLFIGSGMSLYAGMPSVDELIEILNNALSENERGFSKSCDLRIYTDDYVTVFGRQRLNSHLKKIFTSNPINSHLHELLSRISHIKTIVTTNYDHLIEDSYGPKASVIIEDKDVFTTNQPKCRIFKIHGDANKPEDIIITRRDYSRLYRRDLNSLMWSSYIAEISSKHIIFLGYGYEDENIWSDLEFVDKCLKNSKKRRILITRGLDELKARKLISLNIDIVQCDAENFINGLIENIKDNIIQDIRSEKVDLQTGQDFMKAFDMQISITASEECVDVTNISKIGELSNQKIKFTTKDKVLITECQQFIDGYETTELTIPAEKLERFKHVIDGFTFLNRDELGKMVIAHIPRYEGKCKLKFHEQDFTLQNVDVRVFANAPGTVKIEGTSNGFRFKLNCKKVNDAIQIKFNAKEPDLPTSINAVYKVMRAFYLFFSGNKVSIVTPKNKPIFLHLVPQKYAEEFKPTMELFYTLKRLESVYKIRFPKTKIGEILDEEKLNIDKFKSLIDNGYYAVKDLEGLIIQQKSDAESILKVLQKPIPKAHYLSIVTDLKHQLTILGKKLDLGTEQITMNEPSVTVLDPEIKKVALYPIDQILVYHYEKFGLWEYKNGKTVWSANK